MLFDPELPQDTLQISSQEAKEIFERRSIERLNSCLAPKKDPDIIVVCGAPRSGTTLVNNILCASPQTNPLIAEWTPLLVVLQSTYKQIVAYRRHREDFFIPETIFDIGRTGILSLVDDLKQIHQCDKVVVKCPAYSPYIPLLVRLLPGRVRCLGTFRAPEDIIASMLVWAKKSRELNKDHFYEQMSVQDFCHYLLHYYSFIISSTDKAMDSIFMTNYETLVKNPEEEISRYEKIMGLDLSAFDPGAPWQESKMDMSKEGVHALAYTPLYNHPISSSSIDSGKRNLSVKDRQMIKLLCWHYCSVLSEPVVDAQIPQSKLHKPVAANKWLDTLEPNGRFKDKMHKTKAIKKTLEITEKKIISLEMTVENTERKRKLEIQKLRDRLAQVISLRQETIANNKILIGKTNERHQAQKVRIHELADTNKMLRFERQAILKELPKISKNLPPSKQIMVDNLRDKLRLRHLRTKSDDIDDQDLHDLITKLSTPKW